MLGSSKGGKLVVFLTAHHQEVVPAVHHVRGNQRVGIVDWREVGEGIVIILQSDHKKHLGNTLQNITGFVDLYKAEISCE